MPSPAGGEERKISRILYLWKEFAKQTLRRIRDSKVNYCLGFFACFIVVVTVSLLITIIDNTPVVTFSTYFAFILKIFLRLAELEGGELDILISSHKTNGRLNYTLLAEHLDSTDERFSFHSPRFRMD